VDAGAGGDEDGGHWGRGRGRWMVVVMLEVVSSLSS